ncbi:MAG: Xaa-Pro peptidase family protein [Planctomycetaceae bacterium]
MLTETGCSLRRQNLWNQLPQEIEWALIGDPRHIQYLSGFRINPISFSADQKTLLLLLRDGRSVLLADNFAKRSATSPYFVTDEVVIPWYTHRKSVVNRDHALLQALGEAERLWKGRTGLIEPEGISEMAAAAVAEDAAWQFALDDDAEPSTLGEVLRSLRRVKLEDEVALLRTCMRACEAGHRRAFEVIAPGISEMDVYMEVQREAQEAAGTPCTVYGDFRATHSRLHKAGGLPTSYRLQEGDLFILDYSVVIHGYRSDFTNTISVGEPSPAIVAQFEACRDALTAAASALKAGVACRDLWLAASTVLEQRGFGPLAHHAGHGLGMEHPEPPILVSESTDTLVAGDVITLEPGCYIEGQGGMRFEHNYLITESGAEQLSQHKIQLRS